jgi:hypothetical protein
MTWLILAASWIAGVTLAYALVAINPRDDE